MVTQVLITYEDGSSETLTLSEAAFGSDGVEAHGHIVDARIAPSNTFADRDPEGVAFPNHTRLSRSLAR